MDRSTWHLKFGIEGAWSARDFGDFFTSIDDLYDLRLILELLSEDVAEWEMHWDRAVIPPGFRRRGRFWSAGPPWYDYLGPAYLPPLDESNLPRLRSLITPQERLRVRRVEYASPGFSDMAGLGAIVGHVKDFAVKLIDRHDTKRKRKLEDERLELENERLRLENARMYIQTSRELGYSDAEFRRLVRYVDERQGPLARAIERGKVTTVEISEGPQT